MQLTPRDHYDEELLAQARPTEWMNPTPEGRYNLVAIGGGTAGLVAALATAGLGGKAALIERRLLGGDCLNFGCVPSKALIRSARGAHELAGAGQLGYRGGPGGHWEFAAVIERVRRLRAQIAHHDSAARLTAAGVDVFLGAAKFTGRTTLEVDGQSIRFSRAMIATGSRPAELHIDALAELGYETNETIFSLTELPRTLIVIGAGPVGCELAQAFRRLGSEVHLVSRHDRILTKEDAQAADIVRGQLVNEGIHLRLGWESVQAQRLGPSKALIIERGGQKQELIGDCLLVAVGRRPNLESLDLAAASVDATLDGVVVNDYLQTSNRQIYAAGDVCTQYKFTHAADAMARIVVQNALFMGRKRFSRLNIPRTTFTDPAIAHVGLTAEEAGRRGVAIDSFRAELADVDRSVLDGETQGFAVVHARRGTGKIVGGTIVASQAGEMIGELTLLLNKGLSLDALAKTIHCYPTQVEVFKRIADAYQRSRLTPRIKRLLAAWLSWRR